jgi:hypothetical protein
LFASCCGSTQVAPQPVRPGRQSQPFPLQTCVAEQAWPQAPQFSGSNLISVQTDVPALVQVLTSGPLQEHTPLEQVSPSSQATLQLPQLLGSTLGFTHVPPHRTVPVGQVHAPARHA